MEVFTDASDNESENFLPGMKNKEDNCDPTMDCTSTAANNVAINTGGFEPRELYPVTCREKHFTEMEYTVGRWHPRMENTEGLCEDHNYSHRCMHFTEMPHIEICKECGFEEHSAVNRGKRRRGNLHDLHQAINANNLHAVEQVLAQGLSNINERIRGRTALYLAIEKDRSEICRLLLSPHAAHGLDMNRRSKDDKNCIEPPLVTACRKEDLETVKLLLRNGADIDIEDSYYHSSLWVAMRQRNMELAKLLIMNGASVNPTTKWYAAPVYHALKYTRRDNLAELLLMHGASLDIPGETRAKTIVYWAAFHGYTHIIPIMAAVGYNVTRETCIKTPDLNQKLSTNKTYCDWLALERASVPSLQGQCRIVIRKRMGEACRGKHFLRNLATLPLPRKMIEYLSLKDVATANGWQSPWQQSQEE